MRLFGKGKQALDVLHASKRLLPELELACHAELLKARVEVKLQRLGQREVGAVALLAVLAQAGEMVAEDVAEALELGGALVLQAKGKGFGGCQGVEGLEAAVVAQDVEHVAVGFPQKLEPWRHQLAIRAILCNSL